MPVNRGQRRMEQWLRSRCKLELVLKNSLLLLKHLQLCVQRERVTVVVLCDQRIPISGEGSGGAARVSGRAVKCRPWSAF